MRRIIKSKERSQFAMVQDPGKISGDNLNNIRCETNRHFGNKKTKLMISQRTVRAKTSKTCIEE
jgi:hypothetical protein